MDNNSIDPQQFFELLNGSIAETREVVKWLPEWRDSAMGRVAPQAEPAFAVFSNCLPPLAGSTELFARSLAILVITPDPSQRRKGTSETDGDLAGLGLQLAQDVSTFALGMIQDTPALRVATPPRAWHHGTASISDHPWHGTEVK
jgi:hypothetical protein